MCEAANNTRHHAPNGENFQSSGAGFADAALRASNGGSITGTDVAVAAVGINHTGAVVQNGGVIHLQDQSSITGWHGVYAEDANSQFRMVDGTMTITGSQGRAVELRGGASAVLTNTTVDMTAATNAGEAIRLGPFGGNNSFTMTGGRIDTGRTALNISGSPNGTRCTEQR